MTHNNIVLLCGFHLKQVIGNSDKSENKIFFLLGFLLFNLNNPNLPVEKPHAILLFVSSKRRVKHSSLES